MLYTSAKKFKTGKNMVWRLVGVGSQLVLEGLQRCLAHCSLRELVPQYNGPWGKKLCLKDKMFHSKKPRMQFIILI